MHHRSFSFGLHRRLVARARAGGARVLVQVGSGDAARAAADGGADAVIVHGVEAGGHVQSVVGLLPLVAEVRPAMSRPVLAAGGIGDPASARAALAASAAAVVRGTRFVASDECDADPRYKERLLEAEARDTVLTELFDVGWPASQHRVIRNSSYKDGEAAGSPPSGERPGEGEEVASGIMPYTSNPPLVGTEGDIEAMAMYLAKAWGRLPRWSRRQRSWNASPLRCATRSPSPRSLPSSVQTGPALTAQNRASLQSSTAVSLAITAAPGR